jgi:hypothetical protein
LISNVRVVSYADDTYVLVSSENRSELTKKADLVPSPIIQFLKDLGMVANASKTAIINLGCNDLLKIKVGNTVCHTVSLIKALGILIDNHLNWVKQAENAIKTGQKLISTFSHVRCFQIMHNLGLILKKLHYFLPKKASRLVEIHFEGERNPPITVTIHLRDLLHTHNQSNFLTKT